MKEGRVLVVDDDPMVRETLGQVLLDEGYAVDLAVDGEDALARVREARPDAVLLDLMMPGMNGRQFLHALRDSPEHANLPVLLMTAVHGLEANHATLGAEVIYKPFNVEDLLNKVALAVYRARDSGSDVAVPRTSSGTFPLSSSMGTREDPDRGVVLIVEQDRTRLQQLDMLLSARGYTVVSMTRALVQLSRLARALRPRAILLDMLSDGVNDVVRELRAEPELDAIPILVFARAELGESSDTNLIDFVEKQH